MKIPKSDAFRIFYDLEPCPFCKGAARLIRRRPLKIKGEEAEELVTYVKCQDCHARTGFVQLSGCDTVEDAWETVVNSWNTRAALPF